MAVFIGATERPSFRFRYRAYNGMWKPLYFDSYAAAVQARNWAKKKSSRKGYGGGLDVTEIEAINPLLTGREDEEARLWFESQQLPKVAPRKMRRLIPKSEYNARRRK
jgi:hypothetical protein